MAKLRSYTDRAEIYGFVLTDTNSDGIVDNLQVVTTNGGNDSITSGSSEDTVTFHLAISISSDGFMSLKTKFEFLLT